MPEGLISFFVQFLTSPGDIIFDPFAGSNTTGYVAEKLKRNWVSVEINESYIPQAQLRFGQKQ
jgi:site-specific DNA-methyltransferase (cytosine-N4-specific)